MPVYRGPDGRIIEEKTEMHDDKDAATTAPTHVPSSPPPASGASDLDAETVKMGGSARQTPSDDEKTKLVGSRSARTEVRPGGASDVPTDHMHDPVVGWLAVIAGPGQGSFAPLGLGTNTIGRSADDRITLDYGDDQISRSAHAIVTYDPRGRKFYVQHGGGTNLTYVGDDPVLAPVLLQANADIQIGRTTLRFVPLCGEHFGWDDTETKSD